jgi:hypothetical protein
MSGMVTKSVEKITQRFGKGAKKCQNIFIKTQFRNQKRSHQTTFDTLRHTHNNPALKRLIF